MTARLVYIPSLQEWVRPQHTRYWMLSRISRRGYAMIELRPGWTTTNHDYIQDIMAPVRMVRLARDASGRLWLVERKRK